MTVQMCLHLDEFGESYAFLQLALKTRIGQSRIAINKVYFLSGEPVAYISMSE